LAILRYPLLKGFQEYIAKNGAVPFKKVASEEKGVNFVFINVLLVKTKEVKAHIYDQFPINSRNTTV